MKPEIWNDEDFGAVRIEAQALFIGLITQADDEGRLEGTAKRIKALIWPYRSDIEIQWIDELLDELQNAGLVARYGVCEKQYLALPNWRRHQRIVRATPSKIPPFPGDLENSLRPHGGLIEASMTEGKGIKDQGTDQGSRSTALSSKTLDVEVSTTKSPSISLQVREIFAYWQEQCGHPTAKLLAERRTKIKARLRDGYTIEQIKQGVDGAAKAPFINEKGKAFDDIELICRTGSKLEDFISRTSAKPRLSEREQRHAEQEKLLDKVFEGSL